MKEGKDKEHMKGTTSDTQNRHGSSAAQPDKKKTSEGSEEVKNQNIPVTPIDTSPDVPKKDSPDTPKE